MFGYRYNEAKSGFFSGGIIAGVDKATARAFSRFGAFTRRRAQTSLRYSDKPGSAGAPPHVHRSLLRTKTNKKTGATKTQSVSPLREFIYFHFDRARRSVVIGPVKLGGKIGDAPHAIEYGGPSKMLLRTFGGSKEVSENVQAHPYMRPAFNEELKGTPALWQGQVKPV